MAASAGVDGDETVGHGAVAVVVDVDADGGVESRRDLADDVGDERRQGGAVGVAQADDRRARFGGGGHAAQRVGHVLAPGVEEVLGVVDHRLALSDQKTHRVVDHAQILVAAHAQHFGEVQAPGLAHEGDAARKTVRQHAQVLVVRGRHALACGHTEGDQLGVAEALALHAPEELDLLGVRRGEAALDEVDAELVQLERDAHLLVHRDRHAFLLHAVAQGGVVQLHALLVQRVLPSARRRDGVSLPRAP